MTHRLGRVLEQRRNMLGRDSFLRYSRRLFIDWKGAVIFPANIVAEAEDGTLWRLMPSRRWAPLVTVDVDGLLGAKSVQYCSPKRNGPDEQRERGQRSSLSGDMTKHGANSGLRNTHDAGKNLPSG